MARNKIDRIKLVKPANRIGSYKYKDTILINALIGAITNFRIISANFVAILKPP